MITTLMLLVVSILLSGIVMYYSISLVSTQLQTEDVRLSKERIWVNNTGSVAAFTMQNIGGRDLLIDKIVFRGIDESWKSVYYHRVSESTRIAGDLNVTSPEKLIGSIAEIDGRNYTRASSDIPLASGMDLLIYVKNPDNIQLDDLGTTVSIAVYTGFSIYLTECNVESAS